jgi:hypothetical protein
MKRRQAQHHCGTALSANVPKRWDVLFDLSILEIDDSGNDMTILFARNQAEKRYCQFQGR